ncbi:alpha/beta hydrolase [Nonlabens mediterrranea]|uniref:Alpha/beta hydrolase n=1 Tax=Nonlabens mediterrranea TaxID=1419947 RepID=A0ABS0A4T8_9FLAO|nr:alpha/beta hydrolase [Nonlabens mediterrranea]
MKFIFVLCFIYSHIAFAQQVIIDSVQYNDGYRKVRLYVPEHYKTKQLPLLIMLDAQNLFDAQTSYAGEWYVDESIASFPESKQAIVIAVDHGNELRMEELTPFKNTKYGGGKAETFLSWIINNAIPTTVSRHKLQINISQVAIAGSSLGGLFSYYAAIQHPDYFQTAGVFSPSFWWSEESFGLIEVQKDLNHQHYFFAAGTKEGDDMLVDMKRVHDLTLKKGATVTYLEEKGAEHNEKQWRSTFLAFYHVWINQL